MRNKEILKHIGKAVAELDKASWGFGDITQDDKDFKKAYNFLRKGILQRNGFDIAIPGSGRLIKDKAEDG